MILPDLKYYLKKNIINEYDISVFISYFEPRDISLWQGFDLNIVIYIEIKVAVQFQTPRLERLIKKAIQQINLTFWYLFHVLKHFISRYIM